MRTYVWYYCGWRDSVGGRYGVRSGLECVKAERGRLKRAKEDGRCDPWEFAVHENGSDTGRSRLTFQPLACCSRGAFINSSVLIPRIDEWPPIAIPRARRPPPFSLPVSRGINSTSRRIWTQFPPRKFSFIYPPLKSKCLNSIDANGILLAPLWDASS